MTPEERERLRDLAEEATPGPWKMHPAFGLSAEKWEGSGQYTSLSGRKDEEYIAAFNPKTGKELLDTLDEAESIISRIADYGPPQGEKQDGIACSFCDMGAAGYSSRGDGFHDDQCAIKDAQILLKKIRGET